MLGYTKNMMAPMVAFTAAANAIFAVLIIVAFALTGQGVTDEFVLSNEEQTGDGADNRAPHENGGRRGQDSRAEGRQGSRNGTPAELKKAGGIYKHMADMQLSSEQRKYQ